MQNTNVVVWLGLVLAVMTFGAWVAGIVRQRTMVIAAVIGLGGAALAAFAPFILATST